MASGPITSWELDVETVETVSDFILWAPKSLQMVTAAMKLKDAYSLEASLVAQRLKRLPPMWEIRVQSLGQEDPLEKKMVTHSSILAWRIPGSAEPGGLPSMDSHRVGHD